MGALVAPLGYLDALLFSGPGVVDHIDGPVLNNIGLEGNFLRAVKGTSPFITALKRSAAVGPVRIWEGAVRGEVVLGLSGCLGGEIGCTR